MLDVCAEVSKENFWKKNVEEILKQTAVLLSRKTSQNDVRVILEQISKENKSENAGKFTKRLLKTPQEISWANSQRN